MNLAKIMKQAQRVQDDIARVQGEVALLEKTFTAGGGVVTAIARGDGTLVSVKIAREILAAGDAEGLEDLVLTAANGALEEVKKEANARVSAVTQGLNIPGLT
ncbi:MAG: YbaB/EbfC family nucleoid-associated protein [Lentisphaeria bacterium]